MIAKFSVLLVPKKITAGLLDCWSPEIDKMMMNIIVMIFIMIFMITSYYEISNMK